MAKPNAFVDGVSGLSRPPEAMAAKMARAPSRFVTVSFQGGRSGLLDMTVSRSAVWAEVLDSLRQTSQPAYVEVDPETNIITELYCPVVVRVGALNKIGKSDDVEVELVISHARHYLRRKNPDFKRLLEILQTALKKKMMVVVTEAHDGHEIIDVRPFERPEVGEEE